MRVTIDYFPGYHTALAIDSSKGNKLIDITDRKGIIKYLQGLKNEEDFWLETNIEVLIRLLAYPEPDPYETRKEG